MSLWKKKVFKPKIRKTACNKILASPAVLLMELSDEDEKTIRNRYDTKKVGDRESQECMTASAKG
jgi:hypothetical protein